MRVARPIRWLLILVALVLGWVAGGYLQSSQAEARWQHDHQPRPATLPAKTGS